MKEEIVKGILFLKKGKEWKEYYAVFHDSSRTLLLYKGALEFVLRKESKKQLSVVGHRVQVVYEEDQGMANIFQLVSPKGDEDSTLFFATVDEDDRHKWCEAFEEATFDGQLNVASN